MPKINFRSKKYLLDDFLQNCLLWNPATLPYFKENLQLMWRCLLGLKEEWKLMYCCENVHPVYVYYEENHKVTLSSGENVKTKSCQLNALLLPLIRYTIRFQFVSGHWESDSKSASRSNSSFFWKSSWMKTVILLTMLYHRYRTLFPYKPDPMPNFFRHTLMSRIQNLGLF